MSFVKNLEVDEVRNDFVVSSSRKRLWNCEIGLILEFARICEKHNLKWFADYGTLLGAVRHGGFIPWDDDVDVVMPRIDYEKFKRLARQEVRYPFYFDLWYENEEPPGDQNGYPLLQFAKLRDLRTVQLQHPHFESLQNSIWIDIFPLDSLPPFDSSPNQKEMDENFKLIRKLIAATSLRERKNLQVLQQEFIDSPSDLEEIRKIPLRERGLILEYLLASLDQNSRYVTPMIIDSLVTDSDIRQNREWFDEIIYLPFEEISIPVPKRFDEILTNDYGDWRKIVIYGQHSKTHSVDFSYEEYRSTKNSPRTSIDRDEIRDGMILSTWQKKIQRTQLEILAELKRVCEKLGLQFWATNTTLFAAAKFHGFNPEDDFLTLKMPRDDIDRLEFDFPFRFEEGRLMDERTLMMEVPQSVNPHQGIFIEIVPADYSLDEFDYLPFESTTLPVPKNYEELLQKFFEGYPNIKISRKFATVVISADISYHEYFAKIKS